MNAHNTPANYNATGHVQTATYATSTPTSTSESESRIDKAYFLSVRGILKFACLVSEYFFQYSKEMNRSYFEYRLRKKNLIFRKIYATGQASREIIKLFAC
jgi:hypothetical protein